MPGENPRSQVEIDRNSIHTQHLYVVEVEDVIDIHYASLTSQGSTARGILFGWSPFQISTASNRAYLRCFPLVIAFPFGDTLSFISPFTFVLKSSRDMSSCFSDLS